MGDFTHIKSNGTSRMVDVSGKGKTDREASATGKISVSDRVVELIRENKLPKGNIFEAAKIAGILGAKKTSSLIPLCHQIPLQVCNVEITVDDENNEIRIDALVRARWNTGVEMEALTAVSIAALTIYDMIKAVDRGAAIEEIRVLRKSGGKSAD